MHFFPSLNFTSVNNGYVCERQQPIKFGAAYIPFAKVDEAIKKGDFETISKLNDFSLVNSELDTLLHSSARHGQLEISKFLLEKKLNPNQKNSAGLSPFSLSCSSSNSALVKEFLKYDVQINTQDKLGNTPLHYAVQSPKIIELLLTEKANPYLRNNMGQTPFALSYNYPKSLKSYLDRNINPNTVDINSQTLMHWAISKNNLDIANLLRKYNADTNYKDKYGRSPIFYSKAPETIQWLTANGAKINLQDNNEQTVLHRKVIKDDVALVYELLKHGADANIKDNKDLPPLAYSESPEIMKLLLQYKANPNVYLQDDSTLLHNAAQSNNLERVYWLTRYHANPNITDKDNNIPFDLATNNDIKTLLLVAGSNPNYRNYLKQELIRNNYEMVCNLLEVGANPNIKDKDGRTPIFFINNTEQLKELLKYETDINLYNDGGYTPMLHFALLGKRNLVEALRQNGASDIVSTRGETIEDCYKKYETYSGWLRKPQTGITFGRNRYNKYGSPEIRAGLEYKLSLTKNKINETVVNASSLNQGLANAYNELNNEKKRILTSLQDMELIIKHFNIASKERLLEILGKNPKGSKIPVIGLITQYKKTVLTNEFQEEIENDLQEIGDTYNEIITKYYINNIAENIKKYNELSDYLQEGIEYVNYINGTVPTRNSIIAALIKNKDKIKTNNTTYAKRFDNLAHKYQKLFDIVQKKQRDKQKSRTTRKTFIKLFTLGSM